MTRTMIPILTVFALGLAAAAVAEVNISQAADHSVSISTPIYTAKIAVSGNLSELTVKGAKAFTHHFHSPGVEHEIAPWIRLNGNMVAVRDGEERIEWTFGEDIIHVVQEGYNFECQLDPSLKAVVVPGGKGGPAAAGVYPNSTAIVLSNGLTVAYSIPFHSGGARMVPTYYCNGQKKAGDLLEFDLKLGAPADAVELLSAILLAPVGNTYGKLLDGGNQGYGVVHFPAGLKIEFDSAQQNLSSEQMNLQYRFSIMDHRVAGREVFSDKKSATLAASGSSALKWNVPTLKTGFYYVTLSAWRGDVKLTDVRQTIAVDLTNYTHPLTRPADFKEFWTKQDARLNAVPANPQIILISDANNVDKAYEVYLDLPGGGKLHGCLEIPAKPSTAPAQFGSLLAGPLKDLMDKAVKPDYKAPDHVALTVDLPGDGTYTRWTSAADNNNIDCILSWLRGIDFLASRPEVKHGRIMAVGASRTGGLTLIAAALRPNDVCAANGFVQTSCGLSWTDKPYAGWGRSPDMKDPNWKKFTAEAAYVDPVNFVPDVKCAAIFAYGIDDDLSPPQGIEAAYHLCGAAWKRISRDAGGHQYSKGCQQIQQDMMKYLDAGASSQLDQSKTLKEH